jgi:hypothetical protein
VFTLSGATPVDDTSIIGQGQTATAPNTLIELGNDYFYLTNVLSCYSKLMNGTSQIPLNNSSEASSTKLTGPGKFTLTNGEADIENKADNQLKNLISEYILFSREMVDGPTIDVEVTQNIPYFKEYSETYKNTGSQFFDDLKEALDITGNPPWLKKLRKDINVGTAKNDNYYLEQFVSVKKEFIEKVISATPTYITQGFSSDTSVGLDEKLTDKKTRKLTYIKAQNPTTVQNLQDYNSNRNSDDKTFNLKFT